MDKDKLHRALAHIAAGADKMAQAANIIAHGMKNGDSPARIAKHLEDYGLLATDLPEPDRAVDSDEAEWYLPGQISIIYRSADRIGVFGLTPNRQKFHLSLTEEETEVIAHTLLAAANHREEA